LIVLIVNRNVLINNSLQNDVLSTFVVDEDEETHNIPNNYSISSKSHSHFLPVVVVVRNPTFFCQSEKL